MTLDEFEDALLKWGPDISRWPVDQQAEAGVALEQSVMARALLQEMVELERITREALLLNADIVPAPMQISSQLSSRRGEQRPNWLSPFELIKFASLASFAGLAGAALGAFAPGGIGAALYLATLIESTAL
ncbi:MAG: hypothetical protein AAGB04_03710 [Pseudomonadota bacterium]